MGAPGHSGPNRLVMTVSSVSEATSRILYYDLQGKNLTRVLLFAA
jgi:hypothetical protein